MAKNIYKKSMMQASEKALQTIEEHHIKPTAKWHFILKRWLIGVVGIATLILGSLAFAIIHSIIKAQDWDIYFQNSSWPKLVVLSLPFAWVVLFILFITLVYYNFKQSQRGYKYAPLLVIGICLCLSIALGAAASEAGIANKLDSVFSEKIPFYPVVFDSKAKVWQQPAAGLLSGKVVKRESDDQLLIKDSNKEDWTILLKLKNTKEEALAQVGERIKMVGSEKNDHVFIATQIRAWEPKTKKANTSPSPKQLDMRSKILKRLRGIKAASRALLRK